MPFSAVLRDAFLSNYEIIRHSTVQQSCASPTAGINKCLCHFDARRANVKIRFRSSKNGSRNFRVLTIGQTTFCLLARMNKSFPSGADFPK